MGESDLSQLLRSPLVRGTGAPVNTAPTVALIFESLLQFRRVLMRYTLQAYTASNAKRKRLSDNSDISFFISEGSGVF